MEFFQNIEKEKRRKLILLLLAIFFFAFLIIFLYFVYKVEIPCVNVPEDKCDYEKFSAYLLAGFSASLPVFVGNSFVERARKYFKIKLSTMIPLLIVANLPLCYPAWIGCGIIFMLVSTNFG